MSDKSAEKQRSSFGSFKNAMALFFLLSIGLAVVASALPWQLSLVYPMMSVITFCFYGIDKRAAKKGLWRTSENVLHIVSLLGGWPGAILAQSLFRHKTKKKSFRAVFWMTVVINCAAFMWLFTEMGREVVSSIVEGIG